jgi:hypothetical protein
MPDDLFTTYRIVSEAEITQVIAKAIRAGNAGQLSRAGDTFLAGVAADVVADRLGQAGYLVIKRSTGR